jgi:hypothetical protein
MRSVYITKNVAVGTALTLMTALMLIFLIFFAREFHSGLVLANVIAFQLSFIWTCAELLDGATSDELRGDGPNGGDFYH